MTSGSKLVTSILLLTTPVAAYAHGAPHIVYAMTGGFVGGLAGAFLACWFCSRRRAPQDETSVRK